MSPEVGEKGIVYAEEIQQEMLDLLQRKMGMRGLKNVEASARTITDPTLPRARWT